MDSFLDTLDDAEKPMGQLELPDQDETSFLDTLDDEGAEETPLSVEDDRPKISAYEPTAFDKMRNIFRDPGKEAAKATLAMVDSEIFKIRPSQAYQYRNGIDRISKSDRNVGMEREALGKMVLDFQKSPSWKKLPGEVLGAASGTISGAATFIKGAIEAKRAGEESYKKSMAERYKSDLDTNLASGFISQDEYAEGIKNVASNVGGLSPNAVQGWIQENINTPTFEASKGVLAKIEGSTEDFSRDLLPQYIGTFAENPSFRRGFSALSSGVGSLAIAIPISIIAGPEAGAGLLSMAEAGPVYKLAISKGKTPEVSMDLAMNTALATFFLEKFGLEKIIGSTGTKTARFLKGSLAEGSTEITQTVVQNAIKKHGIDDTIGYCNEIIEAGIGGLVGGPAAVMFGANGETPAPVVSEVEKSLSEQGETQGKPEEKVSIDTRTTEEKAVDAIIDTSFDRVTSIEEKDIDVEIANIMSEIEKEEDVKTEEMEIGPKAQIFRDQVSQVVGEEETTAVTSILDARAKATGMTTDEYIEYHNIEVVVASASGDRLLSTGFGGVAPEISDKAELIFTDTKTIIRAFEKADVSSLVHELGHVFRRDIGGEDLAIAEKWAGVVDGKWTVPAEEKFARGWENYLATGQAPTAELQGIFEKFKQWMSEIYKSIKGSSIDVEVTPDIKEVFDRLLIPADGVDSLAQKAEGQTIANIKSKHDENFDTLFISERDDSISIDSIIIPKEGRKLGAGSALMNDIILYADRVGKVVRLTPGTKDDKHGTTSRTRLIKFYKKFGLVENKGRNKDFTYNAGEMYREPSLKQSSEISQTPIEGLADRNKLKVAIAKLEKLKEKDPAKRTATDIKNIRSLEAKKADIEKLISEGGKFVESLPRAKFKGAEGPASTEIELRRSIMNARKAMAKGDKAGVEKERARFQEIVKNAKTRRVKSATIKTLKANIKKELRTAKVKKHTGKFTPEIQDTLDTLIRVSKMKAPEAENKLVDNLEKYLDKDIPQAIVIENHMLEMVARLDTMDSIGGLEELLAEIKALKDEGRMINQLKKFNRESRDIARKEITVEELGGVPDSVKFTGIKDLAPKTMMARAKQALKSHGKTIMGWDDLMDILSGKTKSKPGESFISKDNDLLGFKNKEKKGTRLAIDKMNGNYKEAYGLKSNRQATKKMYEDNHDEITLKKVSFTDPIDGTSIEMDLVFTRAELRERAMKLMDPTLDATFAEMGYNQDTKADIFEALTDQDKIFIESQLDFYQEYYGGVNEVYKEYNGINLPKNKKYSPLRREGIAKPVDDGMGEFLKETSFRASAANPGASKARTANTLTISKISDLSLMERHVSEMEHFKAWAEKIRDMNAIWKDPKVRQAVQINHGEKMLGLIDSFVGDIANGASRMGQRLEGLDKFRSNVVKSMLAAKPAIMLKQLTSFVAFADKMPSGQFAKYMVQFWANPIKNTKDLYSSEMLKARGKNIERDLKIAMQSKEHSAFAKHQSFFDMLMLNVQMGDQGAIVLGGWPYYKYLMDKKGFTHDQAIYKMEKAAEQSQQSGDITEQSAWQRGGSLAKLLTMFQSSQNQYIRKEIGALRNLFNGRQSLKQTAKTLLIFHVMLPMLFQFASDRFTWDEDEQKRAALFGSLNGYFIIGDALDYIIRYMLGMRTFDMEMPVYSAVHDFIKATALVDLFDLSVDEAFKAFESLGGLIGVGTGLPAKQAVRITKGAVDSLSGEYEKGFTEIVGYSPYLADKLAED